MTTDDVCKHEATAAYDEWETQARRVVSAASSAMSCARPASSADERVLLAREFEKLVLRAGTERSSVWLRELREHAERAALGEP